MSLYVNANADIYDSVFSNNSKRGISVVSSSAAAIQRTTVSSNGDRGIMVLPTCSANLAWCDISNNAQNGIYVFQSSIVIFNTPNVIMKLNGECGISYSNKTIWNSDNNITFGTDNDANKGGNTCCYDCTP